MTDTPGREIAKREERPQQPLGPQQVKAAFLLAQGMKLNQVATACHVDRKTLYRWRDKPLFRAAQQEFEAERIASIGHELESAVSRIVDALKEEGIAEMREQLAAADPDGHPLHNLRREAYRALTDSLKVLRPPEAKGGGAVAQAGVYLVIEEPGAMRVVPLASEPEPEEEIEEGTYVEVEQPEDEDLQNEAN